MSDARQDTPGPVVFFHAHPDDEAIFTGGTIAALDPAGPAAELSSVLAEERSAVLVSYDDGGVYGHPDHLQVHRVAVMAAGQAGVATRYEATVDREYLHFVDTHVVELAHTAYDAPVPLGVPTVLVDTTIDVRPRMERKRAAMLAHASQMPADAPAVDLAPEVFDAVYGFEWFLRVGPRHDLDALDQGP